MMSYLSLHLSLHDINLLYLEPSLLISLSKKKKRVSGSVKKSLVRVSGVLHPGDHVLLSLSVEVKSRSILHNYKLVNLSVKILLSSPSLNNCIRNATLYEKNALSVWSWGCLRSNKGEFCVCFEKITDAIFPLGAVDAPAYRGRNRGEMGGRRFGFAKWIHRKLYINFLMVFIWEEHDLP